MTEKKNENSNNNHIIIWVKENKEILIFIVALIIVLALRELLLLFKFFPVIINVLILAGSLIFLKVNREKIGQIKQLKKYLYKNINNTYLNNFKILNEAYTEEYNNSELKNIFSSVYPVLIGWAFVVLSILLMMFLIPNSCITLITELLSIAFFIIFFCVFLFKNMVEHPKAVYCMFPLISTLTVYAIFYNNVQEKGEANRYIIYLIVIILGIFMYYCLICSMPIYIVKRINVTTMLISVVTTTAFDVLSQLLSADIAQRYDNLSMGIEKEILKAVDEYNNEGEIGLVIATLTIFYLFGAYFVAKRLGKYQNMAEENWKALIFKNSFTDEEIYKYLRICCYYGKEYYKDIIFENSQYTSIVYKFEQIEE